MSDIKSSASRDWGYALVMGALMTTSMAIIAGLLTLLLSQFPAWLAILSLVIVVQGVCTMLAFAVVNGEDKTRTAHPTPQPAPHMPPGKHPWPDHIIPLGDVQ